MTGLETCTGAKGVIDEAIGAGGFPTVVGTGVTNGTEPGGFCVAVRESEVRIFPPAYHLSLTQLLQNHGFGNVQVSYEATLPRN